MSEFPGPCAAHLPGASRGCRSWEKPPCARGPRCCSGSRSKVLISTQGDFQALSFFCGEGRPSVLPENECSRPSMFMKMASLPVHQA